MPSCFIQGMTAVEQAACFHETAARPLAPDYAAAEYIIYS